MTRDNADGSYDVHEGGRWIRTSIIRRENGDGDVCFGSRMALLPNPPKRSPPRNVIRLPAIEGRVKTKPVYTFVEPTKDADMQSFERGKDFRDLLCDSCVDNMPPLEGEDGSFDSITYCETCTDKFLLFMTGSKEVEDSHANS